MSVTSKLSGLFSLKSQLALLVLTTIHANTMFIFVSMISVDDDGMRKSEFDKNTCWRRYLSKQPKTSALASNAISRRSTWYASDV
jgi:hypothetical protein